MADSSRRNVLFALAVVAICALIPAAYFLFLGKVTPPPAAVLDAPLPQAPKTVELKLSQISGAVEIRRGDQSWKAAEVGDSLEASDAVRTPVGGSATLTGGDSYEVQMEGSTDVAVDELTESISRLMLGSGMATARVRRGKHRFEVRAAHSDAVASTQAGTFAISSNGKGTVAVGTEAGEVELSGHGKVVIVRSGEQSVVHPGQAPSAPAKIPQSLLLKVRWPQKSELAARSLWIRGSAEPGAQVEVAGQRVGVGDDGSFAAKVRLAEGKNAIEVRARAVGQREIKDSRPVVVDTTPPKAVIRPKWK